MLTSARSSFAHRAKRRAVPAQARLRTAAYLLAAACLLLAETLLLTSGSAQETKRHDEKKKQEAKAEKLLDSPKFFEAWKFFSAQEGKKREDVWKILPEKFNGKEENVLVCLGKPFGYLRTIKGYENYEFSLEWKFPTDANGNSGILVHTDKENDKVWPKSIQVQFHGPKAGSVFPIEGAKTENRLEAMMKAKPNEWNRCVVTCRNGTISVQMGKAGEKLKKVGEVTGCMPAKGCIALQSEGSEVHFRRITLRKLPKTEEKPKP